MPELPEVETVKNGLAPFMQGQTVEQLELKRQNLRFDFPSDMTEILEGAKIVNILRKAKYLLFQLDNNKTLLCHLGMSGRFVIIAPDMIKSPLKFSHFTHNIDRIEKHDHVIFTLDNHYKIIYNDPRRFGYMDIIHEVDVNTSSYLSNLGPEPLGNHFHSIYLQPKLASAKRSLKAILLDQNIIAGLGNIYVCEALFRSRLNPFMNGDELAHQSVQIETLIKEIKSVLNDAIRAGGSSLKDHRQANGDLGYFQHEFQVYGREGENCIRKNEGCKGTIERVTQNGRSTFYCPICQK